jgi:hypothetical protein
MTDIQFQNFSHYITGASLGDIQNGESGIALSDGAKGDSAGTVQQLLNAINPAGEQLKNDNFYGPKTSQRVADFQRANGLTPDGRTDDKTLAALAKKFQQANGLPQTGQVDQATLNQLAQKTGSKPANAPAAAPVTAKTVASTPTTQQLNTGPAADQARAAMTPEQTRLKLDQALTSKDPTKKDILSARQDRATLAKLQGQLGDITSQQMALSTSSEGAITSSPELDAQQTDIQKQIQAIQQRLSKSTAGQEYAELDRQQAAATSLKPGLFGSIFGQSQATITARTDAQRNIDLLKGKLGET